VCITGVLEHLSIMSHSHTVEFMICSLEFFIFIFVLRERLKANKDSNKIPKRLRHKRKIPRKLFSIKDTLMVIKQSWL